MIPSSFHLRFLAVASISCLAVISAHADVKLHGLFSDNMVLQRGQPVPIWGTADDGELVTVEFRGEKLSTRAKGGAWTVKFGKLKAGGPDDLKVSANNIITLTNVLVGEVWIASGQSNMEWPVRLAFEPWDEIANAHNPQLRLYTVPKLKANEPVKDVKSSWQTLDSNSISNFSAVAYYFGKALQKSLGVPVGLIHTSWGGSPAEVWMREQVLADNPDYKRDILDAYAGQLKQYEEAVTKWEKDRDDAKRDNKPFNRGRPWPAWKPAELYNGMIAPLIPYAIKGAIWYQGESNAERAYQYRTLFTDMVRNWRKDWGQGEFPFLQVQLAPFKAIKKEPAESSWAELREAQVLATRTLKNCGIAVITDLGDEKDIHPKWKQPVGERLALAARAIAYGENLVYSGPAYRSMKVKGDKAILSFDHVGEGISARPLPNAKDTEAGLTFSVAKGTLSATLAGFSIAGADRKFVWADAKIEGEKVVVSSPQVPKPAAVRYGWADFPVVNLWCVGGLGSYVLPASPFRTDDWPMITAPKQEAKK